MSHPHPELSAPGPLAERGLRIIPLGGLGEVGRNMTVFEYDGRLLVVDCGVLFPEDHHPGVDLILPDFEPIRDRLDDIEALVLTHGHEDHIGAVPYLLRERGDLPLVGSKLTLALLAGKLREHRLKETPKHEVKEGDRISFEFTQAGIEAKIDRAIEQSLEIVSQRINALGTTEPTIQRQGLELMVASGKADPARRVGDTRRVNRWSLVGAAFVLGKLREESSALAIKNAVAEANITTTSPGLVLCTIGMVLMLATLLTHNDIETWEGNPLYTRVLLAPEASSSEPPRPLPVGGMSDPLGGDTVPDPLADP